jgi:glycosyltransferase involved in cell wall biosynthesis
MCKAGLSGWRLLLVGPVEKGNDNRRFAQKVRRLARGYPIIIKHQSDFTNLVRDYSKAKIYWHAAGYGIDQNKNPQAVEHLGLTTIEAQAAGVVPIVINRGGQPEVVTHAVDGLLWQNQSELIKQTQALINNSKLQNKLSRQAIINAQQFSYDRFCSLTKKIFLS